ncbi:hypothetical protein GCM10010094_27330 [Streptomyces flaveus]|uniref:Methyltransferase domain-containing protein n=2 Tax=Streptomyces flaveus TaxID=66370 RepID=A0A917QRL1_9ACTN|nr:hypothetical protein GCM10010094_27330 [Streptomyces flaveus]
MAHLMSRQHVPRASVRPGSKPTHTSTLIGYTTKRDTIVTAVDISQAVLECAAAVATDIAGRVAWTRADLTSRPPPAGAFDLMSAHYFPLPHQPDHTALRGLLDAVAPGGTLLFATHDLAGLSPRPEQGFDPNDYYQPDDIARLLDHNWTVLINETRPRTAPAPEGTHHTHDTVLRAQRLR